MLLNMQLRLLVCFPLRHICSPNVSWLVLVGISLKTRQLTIEAHIVYKRQARVNTLSSRTPQLLDLPA